MWQRLRRIDKNLLLFALAGVFLGFYHGLYEPTLNNYLNDVFHIGEKARGALEFPREFPGFMVVFLSGAFLFMPITRMATMAIILIGLGLLGQGLFAPGFVWMVIWMVTWSVGQHLYMPLFSTIGVGFAEKNRAGERLGQLTGLNAAASLVGFLVIWLGSRFFGLGYRAIFVVAALACIMAAICLGSMDVEKKTGPQKRILIKKKYTLFYLLNVLFGARKQIFLTFGPWVLIKVYNQPITTFALLGLIGTTLGIFFRPILGKAVDTIGEKKIIMIESLALLVISFTYGFSKEIFNNVIALYAVFVCYILDQLLFAVNMARTTYLNKIVESPQDMAPTLSMGVTFDHVVSMTVPFFGGLLWISYGYRYVFLVAAVIALINFMVALRIQVDKDVVSPSRILSS